MNPVEMFVLVVLLLIIGASLLALPTVFVAACLHLKDRWSNKK